jgi:reactive intermediate/imine deaminase
MAIWCSSPGRFPWTLKPWTWVTGGIEVQSVRVLENMSAVAKAAGGSLQDIIKLTIFLTDLADFATVNETMKRYFDAPYPARSTVQVAALPRGVGIEIEAIMAAPGTL